MVKPEPDSIVVDDLPVEREHLRIAFVTETWPPEVNGVAVTLARVVEGLCARQHRIQLIRPKQDPADRADDSGALHEVLMRGLPIPRYPNLKMGLPSKGAMVRLWSLQRPDLVHIATEGPLGWSALQAALRLKLPVSSDFRTNFQAYSRHYGLGWLHQPILLYLRRFHNQTQCTMVPTEGLRRELADLGFRNLTVLARGVDTTLFTPQRRDERLRKSWGAAADAPVVMNVGRLAAEKNLGVLVDAYEAMRAVEPRTKLVFVGDGPIRRELAQRCPDAHFAGTRNGEDLAAHYASADVFLFPSMTETYGNVTPEAMASGLGVVAYDYAAAARLIRHGDNGLLAPFDDRAAFVQAAVALARDPAQRMRLRERARETAGQIGWEQILTQIESVFVNVMRQGAQQRRPLGLRAGLLPR
jgi:glycosyltransferase involved in cell wall biosynthesis